MYLNCLVLIIVRTEELHIQVPQQVRDQIISTPTISIGEVTMDLVLVLRWWRFHQEVSSLLVFLYFDPGLGEIVDEGMLDVVALHEAIHDLWPMDVMAFKRLSHDGDDGPFKLNILQR